MSYPHILLRPGKDHIPSYFHPWIFSRALQAQEKIKDGDIVDIYDSTGKHFCARGYFNGKSQIAFRALTRNSAEKIDTPFFEKRFGELIAVRERFIDTKNTNAFRIAFGESDGLPGLIIDKYDGVFVMQIHTLGMESLRDKVIAAMKSVFKPETIF